MRITHSFFHQTWLSIVFFWVLIMLSAQAFYMHSLERVQTDWGTIYQEKIDKLIDQIITRAKESGIHAAVEHIKSLDEGDREYFALYTLGQSRGIAFQQELITSTFVFNVTDNASTQLIYFTDGDSQPGLLEIKNPKKNALFFAFTWPGFFLRTFPIFIFALLFAYFWTQRIVSPILTIAQTAKAISRGNLKIRLPKKIISQSNEIGELGAHFNHMIENIESLQNDQQRMLSDIAHELRSPLSRQKLAINLLKHTQTENPRSEALLERIENEGDRLNELIEEVMNYLRPKNPTIETTTHSPIYLASLLEPIIDDACFEFSQQHRSITTQFKANPIIIGSHVQIERAIENIIRNALFYTHEHTNVEVTLDKTADTAIITIVDHGDGVPESALELLKKPFYRTDSARNTKEGGYGLGVAIADTIIAHHNGNLAFENHKPQGLMVTIIFPLAKI